jgi:hypothetical protein
MCFVVGNNSVKKTISRLDYGKYDISDVSFETSGGGMDTDCTLAFTVNSCVIKIDIVSDQQPFAARVYTCLVALCRQQQKNLRYMQMARTLPAVHLALPAGQPGSNPAELTTAVLGGWVHHCISSYDPENYGMVFSQYFQ